MGLKKRGDTWYVRIKHEGRDLAASTQTSKKTVAIQIDAEVRLAVRTKNPDVLGDLARDVARRMFGDSVNQVIPGFNKEEKEQRGEAAQRLTVTEACRLTYESPEIRATDPAVINPGDTSYRSRMKGAMGNLMRILGSDTPILSISVEDLQEYRIKRKAEQAAPDTIRREIAVLSRVYQYIHQSFKLSGDHNPCNRLKAPRGSALVREKAARQRKVYISLKDFHRVVEGLPDWYKPLALLSFYTGMRQGEVRNLTKSRVDLGSRVIRLNPDLVKESDHKIVPLHKDVIPIIVEALNSPVITMERDRRVFLRDGQPIKGSEMNWHWMKAAIAAGMPDFHYHDIRHAWLRNARKSGISDQITRRIMGHSSVLDIHEAYDLLDVHDFVEQIDKLTFNHGDTQLWIYKPKTESQFVNGGTKVGQDGPKAASHL